MTAPQPIEPDALKDFKWSWEVPIEDELLTWARHMKQSNLAYVDTTIWGRRQKQEAEIYARVFEMVEERIVREKKLRESLPAPAPPEAQGDKP